MEDKMQLTSVNWLTDKHIYSLNKLLVARLPGQNGLRDPLILSEYLKYSSKIENFIH